MADLDLDVAFNTEQAEAAVERLEGKVEDLGEATEEAGEKAEEGGEGFGSMGAKVAGAAVAVGVATAALRKAFDALVTFGNELERQAGIINRFEGNIEGVSERLGGLVSDLDLMIARNKLAQAGLSATAEEFGAIAVKANEAAARLGTDFGSEVQRITQALATGGVDALREYGVVVEATGDKAQDSRLAIEELTRQMDGQASSADTLGGTFQVLEVQLANAETQMFDMLNTSEGLNDAFNDLFTEVSNLNSEFASGADDIDKWDTFVAAGAAILQVFIERITLAVRALNAWRQGNTEAALQIAAQAISLQNLNEQIQENIRLNLHANFVAQQQRQAAAAAGGGGGGGGRGRPGRPASAAEVQEQLSFIQELADGQLSIEEEMLREGLALDLEIATERKRISDELAAKRIENERAVNDAIMAAKQEEADIRAKTVAAEDAAAKQRLATGQKVVNATTKGGEQLLQAFGATQGQMELWRGLSDTAQAITSFAGQNYAAGALYLLSAGLHFANAAQMGIGGGGGSQGQAAAAAAGPNAQGAAQNPQAAPGGAQGTNTGGTVVVNFNAPTSEPLLGRDFIRAQRLAQRRFGGGRAA